VVIGIVVSGGVGSVVDGNGGRVELVVVVAGTVVVGAVVELVVVVVVDVVV